MRILKSHPILKLLNSYLIDGSQPSSLNFAWNFGSLLAVCLIIQIVTGVTLAMHYNASVAEAFNSVEHIMRDVNNGWLIRYFHSNTASAFFFLVYLHIGRGIYYGSYQTPRTMTWVIGSIILIVMIATGFLGYVLPYGQMSLWGATVITNLMSAIPWVGQDIVEFIWGGFSVNNATLNRFFALHFLLPFVLAALVLLHLITLHATGGSGNPSGFGVTLDRSNMSPYYLFKDLTTFYLFIWVLSLFVYFMPNFLGDSENYVPANPMQTPASIVPEWYLLSFYAILRSIPNKLLGVIAMFGAILAILTLPYLDLSKIRGSQFKPLSKIIFWLFVAIFVVLIILGAKHVEAPYIIVGQCMTLFYFLWYLCLIPFTSLVGDFLFVIGLRNKKSESNMLMPNKFKNLMNNFVAVKDKWWYFVYNPCIPVAPRPISRALHIIEDNCRKSDNVQELIRHDLISRERARELTTETTRVIWKGVRYIARKADKLDEIVILKHKFTVRSGDVVRALNEVVDNL